MHTSSSSRRPGTVRRLALAVAVVMLLPGLVLVTAGSSPAAAGITAGPFDVTVAGTPRTGTVLTGRFDAGFTSDLLFYGPGSAPDQLWRARGDRTFAKRPLTIRGTYSRSVVADVTGDALDDVLWIAGSSVVVWRASPNGIFSPGASQSLRGGATPLVGTFDGDAPLDVLMWRPGPAADELWFGRYNGVFNRVPTTVDGRGARPVVGDFAGDYTTDILWYVPGRGADELWINQGDGRTWVRKPLTVNRSFLPIVGQFGGDSRADILWYSPLGGSDPLWLGTVDGTFDVRTPSVTGSYVPAVGDFDGSGVDDVLWYAPNGNEALWLGTAPGTFRSSKGFGDRLRIPAGYSLTVGRYDAGATSDVLVRGSGLLPALFLWGRQAPS